MGVICAKVRGGLGEGEQALRAWRPGAGGRELEAQAEGHLGLGERASSQAETPGAAGLPDTASPLPFASSSWWAAGRPC